MNDPYNDDDGYDDDQYDHDYNSEDKYKWYFKFDVGHNSPLSSWINDIINNIINPSDISINQTPGFPIQKFPVNSWNPNTANHIKFQYLGSNYIGEPVWKSKYWVIEPLNQEYKLHLEHHAAHFIRQPQYYKSMFDILN